MWFVGICHHPDTHDLIVQLTSGTVKTLVCSILRLSIMMVESPVGVTLVKLILRNKEYEVKPGMTLLSALQKISVIPESVIATRDGEMILDDEILKDGDEVKLIAVISGG
jgi:sulfur carrier protein